MATKTPKAKKVDQTKVDLNTTGKTDKFTESPQKLIPRQNKQQIESPQKPFPRQNQQIGSKTTLQVQEISYDYPLNSVIDICFTSRAYLKGQRNQMLQPLMKYTQKIESDQTLFHNDKLPDYKRFKLLDYQDGMIRIFKQNRLKKRSLYTDAKGKVLSSGPKILIVVCMYNQGIKAINLTLGGIYNNLKSLQEQGGILPEQVAVVLVQDGILKLMKNRDKRTYERNTDDPLKTQENLSIVEFVKMLDRAEGKQYCDLQVRLHTILDSIDDFKRKQQGNLINQNNDFPPNIQKLLAMLYQNEWWPYLTEIDPVKKRQLQQAGQTNPQIKLKVFSCFKHMNGKKLSSHLWFFEGFCRYLEPEFVVLLDVGTKPGSLPQGDPGNGLTNLIKGFYEGKNIGGLTGLMTIDSSFPSLQGNDSEKVTKKNCFQQYFLSVERAQQYQYIMAHFLDKNFESATGFLHVLPGAWSAYRYHALIHSQRYEQNLLQKSYFAPLFNPQIEQKGGYEQQNMYLAEDRILSLGIYCQPKSCFTLGYVPDAFAYTDPMKSHHNLLTQRRRWINSSLFAFMYVWKNYYFNVLQSDHNFYRSYISINISMLFAGLSFVNSYFTPGLYFFVLYITICQIDNSISYLSSLAVIISAIYIFVLLVAVGGSLIGKEWEKHAGIISSILSFFTFSMFGLVVYNIVAVYLNFSNFQAQSFRALSVIIMIILNFGSVILVVFIHFFSLSHFSFIGKLICDTISYMAYQGAYSQTMVIHGMCNVDDVSWGTKGAGANDEEKKFFKDKVFFVSSWLFFNALLAYILLYIDVVVPQRTGNQGGIVLLGICIYATFILSFKSLLATLNFIYWLIRCRLIGLKFNMDNFKQEENSLKQFREKHKRDVKDFWRQYIDKYKSTLPRGPENQMRRE